MSLETIREVVSMWRKAENRRREGVHKNKREIFIAKQYWLNGRTVALIAQYPWTY